MGNILNSDLPPLDKYEIIVSSKKTANFAKLYQEKSVKTFINAEKTLLNELKTSKPEFIDSHDISLKVKNSLVQEKNIKASGYLMK